MTCGTSYFPFFFGNGAFSVKLKSPALYLAAHAVVSSSIFFAPPSVIFL